MIKALVAYKGVKSKENMDLVYKVLEIKERIKWKLGDVVVVAQMFGLIV